MQVKAAETRSLTGEARRSQIIAATVETLAELGYGQTSFSRIAERAGLSSTRLISYHFAGKSELMGATVAHVYTDMGRFITDRMSRATSAREALRLYITSLVEYIAEHRTPMQAVMEIFLNHRDETTAGDAGERDAGAATVDAGDTAIGHVERILLQGQASGEFRDFDAYVMAATVQRAIDGLPLLLRTRPDLDLAHYAEELTTLFDLAARRAS